MLPGLPSLVVGGKVRVGSTGVFMPSFKCTWSLNKGVQGKRTTTGHYERLEADNEQHVVEVVKKAISELEEVPKDVVNVTGIIRLR